MVNLSGNKNRVSSSTSGPIIHSYTSDKGKEILKVCTNCKIYFSSQILTHIFFKIKGCWFYKTDYFYHKIIVGTSINFQCHPVNITWFYYKAHYERWKMRVCFEVNVHKIYEDLLFVKLCSAQVHSIYKVLKQQ